MEDTPQLLLDCYEPLRHSSNRSFRRCVLLSIRHSPASEDAGEGPPETKTMISSLLVAVSVITVGLLRSTWTDPEQLIHESQSADLTYIRRQSRPAPRNAPGSLMAEEGQRSADEDQGIMRSTMSTSCLNEPSAIRDKNGEMSAARPGRLILLAL